MATLLVQMADLERGERIRALRERLHLTQPTIAERVRVTLRAYQEWEAGGGIQWENAKRLAKALGTTADYLMSGDRGATPDLSLEPSQLDRIETQLQTIERQLRELRLVLAQSQQDSTDQAAHVEQELAHLSTRLDASASSQSSPAPAAPATARAGRRRKPA